jgi:2-(1,2-epoxy-1,2-dihydrophenyl)acetyl-CoA isomerase
MSQECLIERIGSLCFLTLNRPDVANAFNLAMIHALCDELDRLQDDDSVRVVILTGAGKAFCAGGDLSAMVNKTDMFAGESAALAKQYQRGIQRIPRTLERFSKPVIAMINGAAAGAGLDLACMCDLRVASPRAIFTESFAKLSLVPGDGGTFFLERVVGHARAMEMFLTADRYNAQQALNMGLVHRVVDDEKPETLRAQVVELGEKIATRAPLAIEYTKMALKRAHRESYLDQLDLLAHLQGIAQRTQDHEEGVQAHLEQRDPNFKGR